MDINQWAVEMNKQISILKSLDLGYAHGNNCLLPPSDPSLLDELIQVTQLNISEEFIDFYRHCGGVQLPDVWNGYFIFTLKKIIADIHNSSTPTQIKGKDEKQIIVFGADGGGNLFAVCLGELPTILYLPLESIQGNTFQDSRLKPKRVSNNFFDFLLRLEQDTQAFVRHDLTWEYMDKHLYQS